jgi:hypothetical protein
MRDAGLPLMGGPYSWVGAWAGGGMPYGLRVSCG